MTTNLQRPVDCWLFGCLFVAVFSPLIRMRVNVAQHTQPCKCSTLYVVGVAWWCRQFGCWCWLVGVCLVLVGACLMFVFLCVWCAWVFVCLCVVRSFVVCWFCLFRLCFLIVWFDCLIFGGCYCRWHAQSLSKNLLLRVVD